MVDSGIGNLWAHTRQGLHTSDIGTRMLRYGFCVFLLVFISSFFFLAGGWPSNWIRTYMVKIILYWKTILTAETEITV